MCLCVGRLGGNIFNLGLCGAGRFVVVIFFVCLFCRWVLSFCRFRVWGHIFFVSVWGRGVIFFLCYVGGGIDFVRIL